MPRSWCKDTKVDIQDSGLPPEASNPTAVFPEKRNLDETQNMDFKLAIMTMFKDLKDDMNKYLNEDHGNRKSKLNEIVKTIQDIKVELDKEVQSLKRVQIKINLEMKNLDGKQKP